MRSVGAIALFSIVSCVLMAGAAWAETPLRLGAVGYVKADTKDSIAPVIKYLEKGLGREVKLELYKNYDEVLERIQKKELELAILTPIVNLHAYDTLGTKPLGYGVYNNGQFSYRSLILVKKEDKTVQSLKDLKGKKIGYVDKFSASGYVYPKAMLTRAGLTDKDVEEVFHGNHVDALDALDAGKVAAAATYDQIFEEVRSSHRKLADYRVLAESEPIPSEALVSTAGLDEALCGKVRDLLLEFYHKRKGDPALTGGLYLHFIPADPAILVDIRFVYHQVVPSEASH